jgi:hypothetical protein
MSYIKRLDLQVQVIAVRRSIDGNKKYQYDKLNWKIHTHILISPSYTTVNVVICYLSKEISQSKFISNGLVRNVITPSVGEFVFVADISAVTIVISRNSGLDHN